MERGTEKRTILFFYLEWPRSLPPPCSSHFRCILLYIYLRPRTRRSAFISLPLCCQEIYLNVYSFLLLLLFLKTLGVVPNTGENERAVLFILYSCFHCRGNSRVCVACEYFDLTSPHFFVTLFVSLLLRSRSLFLLPSSSPALVTIH